MNQSNLYSFTAKWLWLLFLVIIPLNIFDILTTNIIATSLPFLSNIGVYGIIICNLFCGFIFLKLSTEHDFYKIAGVTYIFATIMKAWLNFTNGGPLEFGFSDGFSFGVFAINFITIVCNIIIIFYETNGHADLVGRYDYELSSKWDKLRTWYIISYCGIGSAVAFAFIFSFIGLLIMLVSLISTIILGILRYVYLYKTAKVFTKLSKEENVSRETF